MQTSRLLQHAGFRHAFFTRQGGVSTGAYASLNFSATTGDSLENFNENLRRAGEHLDVDAERIFFLSQVHGVESRSVNATDDAVALREQSGDIVLSSAANLACAVRTADCVPVLIADRSSGNVAAVHAGWRGVALGVVAKAIAALQALNANGDSVLLAAVGPHISINAFEVSPDVAQELQKASPDLDVIEINEAGKPHVNLRRIVHAQLRALGLSADSIDHVPGCTVTQPELYFSYRRDGAQSGRHLSAIIARGTT